MPKSNKPQKIILVIISFIVISICIYIFLIKSVKNSPDPRNENSKNFSTSQLRNDDYTLVINTNRSSYTPGQEVAVGISVIDKENNPVCSENLKIDITYPDGSIKKLSIDSNEISILSFCNIKNNSTQNADYRAVFVPEQKGSYTIEGYIQLSDNHKKIKLSSKINIHIEDNPLLSMERIGSYKIRNTENKSIKEYRNTMSINVTASEEFKGTVTDYIPQGITIVWYGQAKLENTQSGNKLSWDIDLKPNETTQLTYEYITDTPQPYIYSFGKAEIISKENKLFQESNYWQIINYL